MKPLMQALAALLLGAVTGVAPAQTSSPFPPPKEDMGKYVKNSGAGLDTGCTYRGGGPLVVEFKVPSPVNATLLDGDGRILSDKLGKLIADKVVGPRAKISFPIFDIDDKAVTDGSYQPEVDRLSWNDEFIKTLSGFNNTWVNDSFEIDIGKVKFATRDTPNVVNRLKVEIDTANSDDEYWCMAIDWVGIEFDAAYPYVLAHGIAADRDTWLDADAPGVLAEMDKAGVVYDRFSTGKNGAVGANAVNLKGQIQGYLDFYKAKKVNLIVHSKGGLDSQALATLSAPAFEVLSLGTLSTPHLGSVVADLTLLQRAVATVYEREGGASNDFAQQFVSSSVAGLFSNSGLGGPQPPGLNDLTSWAATEAIQAGLRGSVSNTFTIGADAGPMCAGAPTNAQIDPMNPASSAPLLGGYVYNRLRMAYQSICTYSSAVQVNLEVLPSFDPQTPPVTVLTYRVQQAPAANPNDVVVGFSSANPPWGTPLGNNGNTNHSTVKSAANVRKLLDKSISLR